MIHLSNIELFVRVVEEGSFSAAARFLGVTPSAISRQISKLENELGGRLFQRTTRKQGLTEAGEIYFQHAHRLVEEMKAAQLAVKNLTGKPSGILRVTAEADFSLTFIEPVLSKFLALYPDIQVRLHMSSEFKDLVHENFDVAIRVGHLEDSSLVARKLTESNSVICASPDYLSKHGTPSHPRDLSAHSCLSFRTRPGSSQWRFATEEGDIDIPISGRLNANSVAFLRNAALNDLGIVMIPLWIVREEIKQQRLIPILENFSMIPSGTPINALFSHRQQLAPKARAFINFLAEQLKT
jgi:DNA-binding transcriptional LysR family regulator